MNIPFLNVVIDLSHHNESVDFKKVAAGGVLGVIHKSTHGQTGEDETHHERRKLAKAAKLLWGSYHFGTGVCSGAEQAEIFLKKTAPEPGDLLALDFEPNVDGHGNPMGPDMTLQQAREFVQTIQLRTGAYPMLYGGQHLKKLLGGHNDPVLGQCPLWLAQYTSDGALPTWPSATWKSWTLWQYTGDGSGGQPHTAAGVGGVCERDCFVGTAEQLRESWKQNLNHADVADTTPSVFGLVAPVAASLEWASDQAKGWSALFEMTLKKSDHLLNGKLTITGPGENALYEWEATSGKPGYQAPGSLWVKNKGPLPPNPDVAVGNHIETERHSSEIIRRSHRITPEAMVDPVSKITRDAFRVHFDEPPAGSAGCIAIQAQEDYDAFDDLMKTLHDQGIVKIPLTLKYS